jgi:hypothetical protein
MAPADLPEVPGDFGRVSVFAEARYDDTLARALFLRENGTPRPHGDYENAGRGAIAALVLPDGDDAFRRAPATDDTLWEKMKDLGPAAFRRLFPPLQADVIGADYVAIQWWADSMCGAGAVLARMDRSSPNDPSFQNLRQSLARHLRDVAAKAHPQFGAPWGLVAMFLVSGRSETALQITGSRFVYSARRALGAAG